jgi:hypothetical protein
LKWSRNVYLPSPPTGDPARFYGNVSDYVDLATWVRSWASLAENCSELVGSWVANNKSHVKALSADQWRVTITAMPPFDEDAHVVWTVRSWAGATSAALHLVDWNWSNSTTAQQPVRYPLPDNDGAARVVSVMNSALEQRTANVTVHWLTPHGIPQPVPWVVTAAATLAFNTTSSMMTPWAVILIQW